MIDKKFTIHTIQFNTKIVVVGDEIRLPAQ